MVARSILIVKQISYMSLLCVMLSTSLIQENREKPRLLTCVQSYAREEHSECLSNHTSSDSEKLSISSRFLPEQRKNGNKLLRID